MSFHSMKCSTRFDLIYVYSRAFNFLSDPVGSDKKLGLTKSVYLTPYLAQTQLLDVTLVCDESEMASHPK